LKGEGENNAELKEVMLSERFLTKLMNNHRNQINLEEEINRNMKGKFKLLGHIGLVLFLVSALVLALAPVAQAATAVTNVWVQFTTATYNQTDTDCDFTIHFTPTTSMQRGVDTITVWFPDGSTAMGPDNFDLTSALTTAAYYEVDANGEATGAAVPCTSAAVLSQTGYRITVTTPVDLTAGTPCSLLIEDDAVVKTADHASHDPYYIKVYTSQDTTPVLSDAFDIDASTDAINAVSLALSPDTAGAAGQYTFTVDTTSATELTAAAEDTVTFIFPYGTTVPSSIAADKVSFSNDGGASWSTGTTDATVNQKARMVTVKTPVTLSVHATDNLVRFSTGANILNPQTVKDSDYTDCFCFTSQDELQVAEDGYNVTAGTAVKLGFNNDAYPNSDYSDGATMINMYSSCLFVQLQDQYGNLKDITGTEPTVSLSSSSGTGLFFTNDDGDGTGDGTFTQVSTKQLSAGEAWIYYRDSAAGTHTLTVSHASYTSGTWTITVAPGVSLYDSNNNLIKTYAPLSTAAASETSTSYAGSAEKHGGTYVQDAINASVQGDTVKLGDGIYEVDTVISLSKKITLTSDNGASYSILKPTTDAIHAIQVTTSGTATNPVVIDGLTFQRLRSAYEFDSAVSNAGYDYLTVQNCSFNYVIPDDSGASEAVVWFQVGTITSATVSNNTFSNCVGFNGISGGNGRTGVIQFYDAGGGALSGVTISGNTLTDCNDYGIVLGGAATTHSATISNNTITNGYSSICLADNITSVSVTGNTVTGAYNYGIQVEGTENTLVTIKNNTITGCAGTRAVYIPDETTAAAIIVQYNDIYDNNGYAIQAGNTAVVDSTDVGHSCQYNYYGSATGPAYTALTGAVITKSNPNGTGDTITDYVTYYPWLHKPLADVVADNASYQACTMSLVSGWNTLSTPVKLISTADSIDELIPSGMTIGYYYDSGWQQITTGYVLSPCDAVYVKMSAATDALLKFDAGAFTTPSKALNVGWNLISLASLTSGGTDADDTVASVYLTAANLPGYSQVVSPSLNATQYDMYYTAGSSWTVSRAQNATDTDNMLPGLGYWCYMQNAATLAGLEITPIAPDLD
jgi:hypothetical protein